MGFFKKDSIIQEWVKPFGFAVMILVTSIILIIPDSSGILGSEENWALVIDNVLPYQSFLYHGCLILVPLYMILSGFYQPKFSDIYKLAVVLIICAIVAQTLNYTFEGSGCDFMMLRYGNGNPLAYLLTSSPILYYLLLALVSIGGSTTVILVTMLIKKIFHKKNKKSIN